VLVNAEFAGFGDAPKGHLLAPDPIPELLFALQHDNAETSLPLISPAQTASPATYDRDVVYAVYRSAINDFYKPSTRVFILSQRRGAVCAEN
jgi:hypothetical protein